LRKVLIILGLLIFSTSLNSEDSIYVKQEVVSYSCLALCDATQPRRFKNLASYIDTIELKTTEDFKEYEDSKTVFFNDFCENSYHYERKTYQDSLISYKYICTKEWYEPSKWEFGRQNCFGTYSSIYTFNPNNPEDLFSAYIDSNLKIHEARKIRGHYKIYNIAVGDTTYTVHHYFSRADCISDLGTSTYFSEKYGVICIWGHENNSFIFYIYDEESEILVKKLMQDSEKCGKRWFFRAYDFDSLYVIPCDSL
jgi:hypothetical protein